MNRQIDGTPRPFLVNALALDIRRNAQLAQIDNNLDYWGIARITVYSCVNFADNDVFTMLTNHLAGIGRYSITDAMGEV
jgi:hypothetical protein